MFVYALKVVDLKKEASDTVTVCFKQPGLKKIKYLPGQYLTLIFRINGRRYIRPYSFSSAPGIDDNLEVTIKRVQGGIVSNHINDKLTIGDMVEVMNPLGDFTLEKITNISTKHIVLWGAGSGITPLVSIAKYVLHNKICEYVTLVYGNKSFESTIFLDKINALKSIYSNFSVFHFHSQLTISDSIPNVIEGRINPELVLSIINKQGEIANTVHYICGPFGLKESVKVQLNLLGVESTSIYTEDFEIIRDPADFEDIHTQEVGVKFDNVEYKLEVVKGKTILEAGLDAGIELPYSCQIGSCSVCKGKLVEGESKMIGLNKKPENILEGEFLLCCTHPLTNNVCFEV